MIRLFVLFLGLLVFRTSPADMPAGWRPVGVAVGWFLLVGVLLGLSSDMARTDWPGAMGQSLLDSGLDLLVLAGYSVAWTRLRRFSSREPQMLTALFGAMGMLGVLFIPLMALMPPDMTNPADFGGWGWLVMTLFLWNLVVVGQIYRRTLALSAGVGVLLALGYFVASTAVSLGLSHAFPSIGS
ncbi:hypothetical protein [Halothiobacillus sp.]|uniref:hypothetical protein n=1 Tax=Halothiobacillus sp. TaxID=1891311 RepID=UPI002AD394AD|nr:hypothetical protein [Halothiobacillus sp.]